MNYIVFKGVKRVGQGNLAEAGLAARGALDEGGLEPVLVFDGASGKVVDLDLGGDPAAVVERLAEPPRGPGRPKLGVVAREVTLLPRHWDWLASQPGGASVALRKLVEQARRELGEADRIRKAREAAYRFMSTMAGNERGFEEAARALFAGNRASFESGSATWPPDVREAAQRLAEETWGQSGETSEWAKRSPGIGSR